MEALNTSTLMSAVDKPAQLNWTTFHAHDRVELLSALPQGGVVGEVGVFKGNFSRRILEIVAPERLHLIDPWVHQDIPLWHGRTDENHLDFLRDVQRRFQPEIYSPTTSSIGFTWTATTALKRCERNWRSAIA
jgi:hypothetical protein